MTGKQIEYTESLGELPDSEMIQLMERYRLNDEEKKIAHTLAIISAIQTLASFSIVPVFITFASLLTGGDNYFTVAHGLAGYALSQLLFHPIINGLAKIIGFRAVTIISSLFLSAGSLLLAYAMWKSNLTLIIFGRILQGMGSIMVPLIALGIERCRPQARGALFVLLGTGMGLGFSMSMPFGSALDRLSFMLVHARKLGSSAMIQAPIFLAIAFALLGLLVIFLTLKNIPRLKEKKVDVSTYLNLQDYWHSLLDIRLVAIYLGGFLVPFTIMLLFFHIPFALRDIGGIARSHMWFVYLFTFSVAFLFVIPFVLISTGPRFVKRMLLISAGLLLSSLLLLVYMPFDLLGMIFGLTFLFVAFNLSEMTLSRIIPRLIEPSLQASSLIIFFYLQIVGTVLGSYIGAAIMTYKHWGWLYLLSVILIGIWLSLLLMVNYKKTDYTLPLEAQEAID
ncbi:MAG: MFS transporter [Pseudomonadota bacterium]